MKIRSHLVILVLAVLAPTALLTAAMTVQLWQLQRQAYEQRFLERVSALRLALDTDIEATQRVLRTLSEVPELDRLADFPTFSTRLARLLVNNPSWTTIGLLGPQGQPLLQRNVAGGTPPALDTASWERLRDSRTAVVSELVVRPAQRGSITYIAVPVLRAGAVQGALFIGIEAEGWLRFLRRYPVAESATLTLIDRDGLVIARTLNNAQWVGRPASPGFIENTREGSEGVFQGRGLEGQQFYSAYSRLRTSSWALGTGVPKEEVEAALRGPTLLMVGGVLAAAALALGAAWLLSRRIADALTRLAQAAALGDRATAPAAPLRIREAEQARLALLDAAQRLHRREQALAEALREEERSRLAAERASAVKDEFLAMLSHELRNPLSAITAAIALLATGRAAPQLEERAREIVQRQIRHLTRLVNELLDVSRLTSGKLVLNPRRVDLAPIVQQVVESFASAGRTAHLQVTTRLHSAFVCGDEARLEQIVSNLLDNACKYTPAGGSVELSLRGDAASATLQVRDSGSGITKELLPAVFELFFQGERTRDRAKGGMGVGLTVVRRLVELHAGSVAVDSDGPGCGAVFTVKLPIAPDSATAAQAGGAPDALAAVDIVLVEDNADIRESMRLLLTLKGHRVAVAADGPSGLAAIRAERPQVAVLDIGLPGYDGVELARRVREDGAASPMLIALTGYGSEFDRAQALQAGFDAFLVKPFDLAAFERAVAGHRAGAAAHTP